MKTIFMETTIQINKFLGDRESKNKIREICKGNRLISSTYVFGEYKSNIIKDTITLYNLVNDSEDLGEVVIRFEKYRERIAKRMCKVFGNILKHCHNDKSEVLDELEMYIDGVLENRFYCGLDRILIDETKCCRSCAKPKKEGSVWSIDVSCRKKPSPRCNINKFILIKKIEDINKITNLPEPLHKVEETLYKIKNRQDKPYGNNCRTLGDTIISLESPDDAKIFTLNTRDFNPLCDKIGKSVV